MENLAGTPVEDWVCTENRVVGDVKLMRYFLGMAETYRMRELFSKCRSCVLRRFGSW